jgi:hypothetical protein
MIASGRACGACRAAPRPGRGAGRRLTLRAAPAVIAALEADPEPLADAARAMTHRLVLRCDPAVPSITCVIEDTRG